MAINRTPIQKKVQSEPEVITKVEVAPVEIEIEKPVVVKKEKNKDKPIIVKEKDSVEDICSKIIKTLNAANAVVCVIPSLLPDSLVFTKKVVTSLEENGIILTVASTPIGYKIEIKE